VELDGSAIGESSDENTKIKETACK